MRTHRFALLAATTTLGMAGLVAALPSHADPSPTDPLTNCYHVEYGSDSYTATFTQPKKKKDPATLISATAHAGFKLGTDTTQATETASCVGATYTLHVKNYDGTQDSSQSLDYQGFTATPSTGTATVVDPSEVDITWNGDGSTAEFGASVTTGPNDSSKCVDMWVTTAVAGQQMAATNHAPTCYSSSGGNTFLG